MRVNLGRGTVSSAWRDSFTGRDGEEVEYWRALVTIPGEKPLQLKIANAEKFEEISEVQGIEGEIFASIDCEPGRRQTVAIEAVEV